ncbi:MAG: hypothetical protein V1798_04055 [Pseudomonadota bacterium]
MIRNLQLWLPSYLRDFLRRKEPRDGGPLDLLVCVADHFEPLWNQCSDEQAERRMATWIERFPTLARRHQDSDGRPPVHTFFFPGEQYRSGWLEALGQLCRDGLAEVELHLHHGNDNRKSLTEKLVRSVRELSELGLLSAERGFNDPRYAFIHGDWALADSGPGPETCGVPDELQVLVETGCYADFTFPSAPSPTQIPTINRIFFADPRTRGGKPHRRGAEAEVGAFRRDELLLIEGPLGLDWSHRKFGIFPRIENGELSAGNPPHPRRVPLWLKSFVHVKGTPGWRFIKLYSHGAVERNQEPLLGEAMDGLLSHLERDYNDGEHFRLHYLSAREMYNIARAAMDGKRGNAGTYRDYILVPRWRRQPA